MKKPIITGEYIPIYLPEADIYKGPTSTHFKTWERYETWVPNDHMILKGDDGCWHAFGITHPLPPSDFDLHDAEWQSFHCATSKGNLCDFLYAGSFEDKEKVLYPQSRPNEDVNQHSPAIVKRDDLYYMFYGPGSMRYATSPDLYDWTPMGEVFLDHKTSRDPNLYIEDGVYRMTYCLKDTVVSRTSTDLINWSDSVEIFKMTRAGDPESPVIIKYEDYYYLFWCIWDDTRGPYDYRTFVYASKDVTNFKDNEPVATLNSHCPEIIVDEKGTYYISSAEYPCTGVSIAPLSWEDHKANINTNKV